MGAMEATRVAAKPSGNAPSPKRAAQIYIIYSRPHRQTKPRTPRSLRARALAIFSIVAVAEFA